MRSDIYHLVTVKDGKSDSVDIIRVLAEMAGGRLKCDLSLLNYYYEIPVSYSSTITTVETDSVELAVHEHQALIIKHDNSTLLKSKHFHNGLGVHCYASYVNVPKKTAILHNFAYAQIRAERREAVRVKVRGKIPVTFTYDNVTIKGCMVDISGTGLSIRSDLVPATNTDQPGKLDFMLNGTPLSVHGSFVRSISGANDENICVFQIKPDWATDNTIGLFIYQQQVDIILELKDGHVA